MTEGLDVDVRLPARSLEVAFNAEPGEVVGIVGPAGAGKSAVVRAIAGLGASHEGTITFAERRWDDDGRRLVRSGDRRIGLVMSDPLLLPQLDVRSNIAIAIDAGGAGPAALAEADVWVDVLGLAEVGSSRVGRLSLGQAQRASLGRALASTPALLLLDRPLARLQGRERAEMRRLLSHALQRFDGPALIITEDPTDAYALADRLVVVEEGQVSQEGDLRTVTRRPGSEWVAANVGLNLYRGGVRSGVFTPAEGDQLLDVVTEVRGPALAMISPRAVALHRGRPTGTPRNVWHGGVVAVNGITGRMRVSVVGRLPIVAEVTPQAVAELDLARGGGVWVSIKATAIEVFAD